MSFYCNPVNLPSMSSLAHLLTSGLVSPPLCCLDTKSKFFSLHYGSLSTPAVPRLVIGTLCIIFQFASHHFYLAALHN